MARNALLMVLGILAVLWIIQIINNADHYQLSFDFAIQPRIVTDLPYILTAPFLHWSWSHIEGNSIPLLVLGFLAAYRSIPKFIGVTAVVIVTSGLAIWLFSPTRSYTDGASGVIFGYFGYVIVRGFFNHNKIDIVLGVVIYGLLLPHLFRVVSSAPSELPGPHRGPDGRHRLRVGVPHPAYVSCGWHRTCRNGRGRDCGTCHDVATRLHRG